MRAIPLQQVLLLSVLLAGCLKPGGAVESGGGATVAVATVLQSMDRDRVASAPDRLSEHVGATLSARDLVARPVSTAQLPAEAGRSSGVRLARLAEADSADLLLLIEATPSFSSQMAGRYRWSVDVTLSLASADHPEAPMTRRLQVPVFLQFYHQQEEAALAEASPMIARELGRALDEFLGARRP